MTSQTFIGSVKSYNPAKGWGFVESPESTQMFGADVFLLKSSLGAQWVNKGDQVSFKVQEGPRGVQATDVEVLFSSGPPNGGGSLAEGGQVLWGMIQSFTDSKGYGFIACDVTHNKFGKDVFFLKSVVKGGMAMTGAQVQFSVCIGDRGPVANHVQIMDNQWGNQWGGGSPQGWNAGSMDSQSLIGAVKSYNTEKGFGFIASDMTQKQFGKDVFFLKSVVHGGIAMDGSQVQFSVTVGARGPVATHVQLMDSPWGADQWGAGGAQGGSWDGWGGPATSGMGSGCGGMMMQGHAMPTDFDLGYGCGGMMMKGQALSNDLNAGFGGPCGPCGCGMMKGQALPNALNAGGMGMMKGQTPY